MTPSLYRPILLFCLVFAMPGTAAAGTVGKRLPGSAPEIQLSFAPVVRKVAPAVVNIYTKRVVQRARSPFFNDPLFRQFFGDNVHRFGAPRKRVESSLGSGVIVRANGIVITNQHVIAKADQITVILADKREMEATVILADEKTDLAVLRLEHPGGPLPFLRLGNSDDLEVGDLVLAIGNPFGVGQTVTSGIVSALARAARGISDFSFFIQTDAAINPGNSGGALVTMDGRLVGINTAIYSRSGGSMGIGFAIPSNMVARIIDGALSDAKVVRPWFGATGQALTSDLAASLGVARPGGVLISDLYPGGPAASAGLRSGDVVTAIDGREVADPRELRYRIATFPVGSAVDLTVIRKGRERLLGFALEAPPEIPPRSISLLKGRHPLAGATVANLSPAFAEELSLNPMKQGVIVLDIARRSPAHRLRLEPGDQVVSINRRNAMTVANLQKVLKENRNRWRITIRRGRRLLTAVIEE